MKINKKITILIFIILLLTVIFLFTNLGIEFVQGFNDGLNSTAK